jgi:hypothetical protein
MMTLETVSVADTTLLAPPAPLQVKEYDVVVVSAPVLRVPLIGSAPVQPAEAVHEMALLEFQVSVDVPPGAMTEGLTVSVTVGLTLTVAVVSELVPPGPVHASEYEVAVDTAAVLWVPLVPSEPLHPPEAVHAVALVEVHVNVALPPAATTDGAAVNIAAGTGIIVTVTVVTTGAVLPPGPVQTSEYAVVAVNRPVL